LLVIEGLKWLLLAVEIGIALPVLYLSIISVSAVLAARKIKIASKNVDSPDRDGTGLANFAILIPAHNEHGVLNTLLDSLSHLAYPRDRFTVYVVADNCTDDTAALARATGWVRVYERFDAEKRGKGFALNWIMERLEEEQQSHDAYVILDADSVVVPTFLQSMSRELARGARALQGCNTVLNVTDSPSTALRWLALTLMNHVRPLGRNGLGASSNLSGNGMCLSRAVLVQYPWQAFALAEDYQYYLTLIEHGERVRYVPDAVVRSQMPTTFSQMRTQDIRWESSSGGESKWRVVARLLKAGLRHHDFARLEAIGELLTPPLSLLVGASAIALVLSLIVQSLPEIAISMLLVGGLVGYIATALYLMRPSPVIYKALLHAPGFMLWKLWVIFVLRRSKKHADEWVRTSRTTS
jgi:cellulose synthase/poly-beta-1,6-N-acetylglucosamine synthase-like glycosyltransferase